uniref:Retrovirus-related Pol polyprotein from transposon TNT 1-94 n=1 Tax=Tanacetum cinerariifolium TaxID=118510 RepID=A0A6L2P672_TANCI|nr:retrovirus-related Pol polyprotein from transposon TNT 1-94 [Tanacetum cinerariifolium]
MVDEKPSTKVTFYKAFFSSQWKFLIHTILQCISAKRTTMNEFRSSMASAIICLATGMLVQQQVQDVEDAAEDKVDGNHEVSAEPTPPSPTPATPPPSPTQEPIPSPPQAESAQHLHHLHHNNLYKRTISPNLQWLFSTPWEVGRVSSTEVVTTATQVPKASAPRRRKGVVIQDPEETTTTSVIVHLEVKSQDKGKGILIEERKPLERQAQIKQDEAFARQLEAELDANINWNDVVDQVKRKEKQDNTFMRYQALMRKPVIEAQARKNIMVYLKNMAGFKMDFFKERRGGDRSRGSKRKVENLSQDAAKKQRIDEEEEELKRHLQIVVNDDDDVFTEATPLALKVPVVDYQIHHEHNKPYNKIIRADGTHQLFLSFITLMNNFDREDLEMLWKLVQERFQSSEPKNFSDEFLLNTFKIMFEKPNTSRLYAKGLLLVVEDLKLLYKVVSAVQIVSAASIVVNTVSNTRNAYAYNDAINVSCNSRLCASYDVNDLFVFNDISIINSRVSKMPFGKKLCDSLNIVHIYLWIIDSGCSKNMMGNHSFLTNFVENFIGMVRFGNNDFVVIASCGDVVIGTMMTKNIYYVKDVRTDNGTEFKIKILAKFFDEVGITQQFSAARTPQQNGIVERRNRILVKAARTMLTFIKVPLFLWAEAFATACFTQNRSIIHKCFDKTPYELINKRKPNIKFFHVFGCRCYLLNDYDDVGKLKEKGDIGVFVEYLKEFDAFRIYNKRTRKKHESVNVIFDEISEMASKQFSLEPSLS